MADVTNETATKLVYLIGEMQNLVKATNEQTKALRDQAFAAREQTTATREQSAAILAAALIANLEYRTAESGVDMYREVIAAMFPS